MLDLGRLEHPSPTSMGHPLLGAATAVDKSAAPRRLGGEATMEFLMQPINRTLLEEVDENNTAMEPVHYPVSTPPVVELPARSASSADGKICAENGVPGAGSADKQQTSEHSIDQVDPKTPGWTQSSSLARALQDTATSTPRCCLRGVSYPTPP